MVVGQRPVVQPLVDLPVLDMLCKLHIQVNVQVFRVGHLMAYPRNGNILSLQLQSRIVASLQGVVFPKNGISTLRQVGGGAVRSRATSPAMGVRVVMHKYLRGSAFLVVCCAFSGRLFLGLLFAVLEYVVW